MGAIGARGAMGAVGATGAIGARGAIGAVGANGCNRRGRGNGCNGCERRYRCNRRSRRNRRNRRCKCNRKSRGDRNDLSAHDNSAIVAAKDGKDRKGWGNGNDLPARNIITGKDNRNDRAARKERYSEESSERDLSEHSKVNEMNKLYSCEGLRIIPAGLIPLL